MSDKVVFNMERDVKRDFWERCFVGALGQDVYRSVATVAENADRALEEWKKRFEAAPRTPTEDASAWQLIPEGAQAVRFGVPLPHELYLTNDGHIVKQVYTGVVQFQVVAPLPGWVFDWAPASWEYKPRKVEQQKDPTHRDGPFADRVYNRLAQMGGPQ